MANHYQTLGVPNFSSSKVVHKAFRRLALQYHPDKHNGNKFYEDKFKQINASNQVLSDPRKKAIYDEQLLYGTRVTATVNNQSQNRGQQNNPPHQHQQKEKTSYEYKPKPEKELKYSEIQKIFIKVSLGMMVLFLGVIVFFNLFHRHVGSKEQFEVNYQGLLNRIEKSKKENDFFLMEKRVDSIKYYTPLGRDNDVFSQDLCWEVAVFAEEMFFKEDYKSSMSYYDFYVRVCAKYGYQETVESKIKRAELYLIEGNPENAKNLGLEIMDDRHFNARSGFVLTNVLLKYQQFQFAESIVSTTIDRTLKAMSNRFGAVYLDVIATGEVDGLLKNGMIQSVCLNRNFSKTDRVIQEDFIVRIIEDEDYKAFYRAFKKEGFLKSTVLEKGLSATHKTYLEELLLANFYK